MVLEEKGIYDVSYNSRKLIVETNEDGKIIIENMVFQPQTSTRFSTTNMSSYQVQIEDYNFKVDYVDGRVYLNGREVDFSFRVSVNKIEKTAGQSKSKQSIIYALIPGTVTGISVKEGDSVEKDQTLLFLEAMKMRNEIRSPITGKIETISVKIGHKVSKGDLLVIIKPN
jgi:biotin carboxyl carrier protein